MAEPVAERCNSAEAELPVPGHSDCWPVAERIVVEPFVAGTDEAGRPAAEAADVVAQALGDTSADTAAEQPVAEQRLEAADKSTVLPGIEAASEQAAGVRSIVAVAAGTAGLGTARPAGSGSHTELAAVGTAEWVVATDSAEPPDNAWASAEQNSFPMSMSRSRRSAGTD